MSDELKPCPFCGGEAHLCHDWSSEAGATYWNVLHECDGPQGRSAGYGHAMMPWYETPWYTNRETAIDAWNRRAVKYRKPTTMSELERENAKLREEFNKMDVWHSKELTAAMDENAKLRELCADIYKRFRGVVFECWAYSSEDFRMYEQRMSELGVEVEL